MISMEAFEDEALRRAVAELGVVDEAKLTEAWEQAQAQKRPLDEVLVDRDLIGDENLGKVISDLIGVPLVRLSQVAISPEMLVIVPEVTAKKQKIVAWGHDREGIKLAMVNPKNTEVIEFIAKKTGEKVTAYLATKRDMEQALGLYKRDLQVAFSELAGGSQKEAHFEKMVDLIIEYAYANRASDIHIEPERLRSVVRFRVDGVLHDVLEMPKELHGQAVSRIKVMSKLRTDEKMAAQDGKAQVRMETENLDVRVSVVPVVAGEKVVMRLLSSKSREFSLQSLGMSEADLARVTAAFNRPYGMVLATGPTGCGKTTTIYSVLKIINERKINIATIEDPVEYDIAGINQIQVNPKTNLTFASGLRAILRQDPNVIFVGEIRDSETADIAVNSAMTGHLVLSTLHTNDAATTLPRLMDLGVEPFLVATTVNVIMGQRLVRRICMTCRVSQEKDRESFGVEGRRFLGNKKTVRVYTGKGCKVCYGSGYQGRVGIFEVLQVSERIRELISKKADFEAIRKVARGEGMTTMLEDGWQKVLSGVTTVEEVLRATRE